MAETTSTRFLLQGYTASASIDLGSGWEKVMCTSFSLSMKKTLMQSQAAYGYAVKDGVASPYRTKGQYIQDIPTMDLSLDLEISRGVLRQLVNRIRSSRNGVCRVRVKDESARIIWEFEECYIQSARIDVQKASVLAPSLTFYVKQDSIGYEWIEKSEIPRLGDDKDFTETEDFPKDFLIAYYSMSVKYRGEIVNDVVGFSFGFNQNITPKYECRGEQSNTAIGADYLLFGLPEYTFSYDRVIYEEGEINFSEDASGTNHRTEAQLNADRVQVYLDGDEELFSLTGAIPVSVTPSIVQMSEFQTYSTEFQVDGTIE